MVVHITTQDGGTWWLSDECAAAMAKVESDPAGGQDRLIGIPIVWEETMPTAPESFAKRHTKRKREEARGTKQQRGYGGEWERISKLKRQRNPVCEICNDAPSEDVDHIQKFNGVNDPKRTEWGNLRAVCRACHAMRHNSE